MISIHDKSDHQIQMVGLEILQKELGTDGLLRFLQQFERGTGDYTLSRQNTPTPDSVDSLVAEIMANRTGNKL